MKSRVAIAALWTYLGLYGWSMYAGLAGINFLWGPVAVLAATAVVLVLHIRRRAVVQMERTAPAPNAYPEPA
jgi:hypothetical protein